MSILVSIIKKYSMDSKVSEKKMQKIQSQFKYQSLIHNVQRNFDVDHRGIKKIRNNKLFLPLNVINEKIFPYSSKAIIRQ